MSSRSKILDIKQVNQKLNRLAWEIYEDNFYENEIVIVGVSERGLILAKKLTKLIKTISNIDTTIGGLNLDKDNPYDKEVEFNLSQNQYINKVVIIVDDVLNSGKTLMYASKHFLNTPLKRLSIMVLVDRNHNTYPIKADYTGLTLATTLKEYINVVLKGDDKGVYLF
tara:strand:- start:611 stop:1114 length:504 start_codon:yes stop_codon:yes gene_type:complete